MKNNLMSRKIVNVDKTNHMPITTFKQEDDAVLKLSLFANSTILDCTGQTIKLDIKRPDGKLVTIDNADGVKRITIANKNEIDITMTTNCFIATGFLECDLVITDASGKMTTASFFITVNRKVTGSENIVGANVIGALDKLEDDFKTSMDDMKLEYETWKDVVLSDNNVANLQNQINKTNSSLDNKTTELNTVSDMKSYNAKLGEKIRTFGYYSADDGGGAKYVVVNVGTDDGGSTITLNNGLKAKLVHNGVINARQYGVKLDNISDDTVRLNAFFKMCGTAKLVIDNGIVKTTDTIFVKGKWRKDSVSDFNNSLTKVIFDNSSINYVGSEGKCICMFFNHYASYIEGLAVTRTSTSGYVDMTMIWHTEFKNFDIPMLCMNKDTTIIQESIQTKSLMTNKFSRGYINGGKLYMDSTDTYINSINFYDVNFFSNKATECVELIGTSFQNLNFNSCDLSYATNSLFKINSANTTNGIITFDKCYFDSDIPLTIDNDSKGYRIVNMSGMDAGSVAESRKNIYVTDYLRNTDINSYSPEGNFIPYAPINLCKNGNLYHTDTTTYSWITNNATTHTFSFVNTTKNTSGKALRITMLNSRPTINFFAVPLPFTSNYTVGFRCKKISGSGKIQLSNSGKYLNFDFNVIPTNKEVVITNNGFGVISQTEGATFSFGISIPASYPTSDLVLEIYEIFILPGTMVQLGTQLHPSADFGRNLFPTSYSVTRPTTPFVGQSQFDTALKKPIWWNGTNWVDGAGTIVT